MNAPQDFGSFLRRQRELRRLPLPDVASRVGMDPARLNSVEAGLVAPPDADALVALVNVLSLNPADAQSLLELAHQARTSERFGAPPAPQTGQGLLQRAQERSAAAEMPAPAAEPPSHRPGPQTIIRGLRADMVASAIEEAEANRDEPADRP